MREIITLKQSDEDCEMGEDPEADGASYLRFLTADHKIKLRELVTSLGTVISNVGNCSKESHLEQFLLIIKTYSEQPTLLDCLIPEITEVLLSYAPLEASFDDLAHTALLYIDEIAKVRGYKIVIQQLPHQVFLLEKLITRLEELSSQTGLLSAKRVMLWWLWFVCKNPFEFSRFDPPGNRGNTLRRILAVSEPYLDQSLVYLQRDAANVVSQCTSRTDGVHLLPDLIAKHLEYLKDDNSDSKVPGSVFLLLSILKHTDRKHLLAHVNAIMDVCKICVERNYDSLLRKCFAKLVQRSALVLLRPNVASWRYKRGKRKLEENLTNGFLSNGAVLVKCDDDDEEVDDDINDNVEWALSRLLVCLSDDDTAVRWSAAKGVGRIMSRLPKLLATQVVDSIVSSNFHHHAGNGSWHGGCMAIAELARRGFLLPESLPDVLTIVEKALFYEEPMGRHALGSNVRDSACYILWAFARAYEPQILLPYLDRIGENLMCAALFDREIRIRKAASASFQENVGRLPNFPDGIALLTIVDFFAVGNRQRCYTDLSVQVAKFSNYSTILAEHLVTHKVVHWDANIRILASEALGKLTAIYPDVAYREINKLIQGCREANPVRRHGFILAFARTLKGFLSSSSTVERLEEQAIQFAASLPQSLEEDSKKLKSLGGEWTRLALLEFIKVCSEANLRLESSQVQQWLRCLESISENESRIVIENCKKTASVFIPTYLSLPSCSQLIMDAQQAYLNKLSSSDIETILISVCNIISCIPARLLKLELYDAVASLVLKDLPARRKWAFMRCAAVECVAKAYKTLPKDNMKATCITVLFAGLDDYTEDQRGDIGRCVREMSLKCIADVLTDKNADPKVVENFTSKAVQSMIQQSAEKIGRTRQCACHNIQRLLNNKSTRMYIKAASVLDQIYMDDQDFIHDKVLITLSSLLHEPEFFTSLLHGLVFSSGGRSDVTTKCADSAIFEYIGRIKEDRTAVEDLVSCVSQYLSDNIQIIRVRDSILRFLPRLLSMIPADSEYVASSKAISSIVQHLTKFVNAPRASPVRIKYSLEALSAFLTLPPENIIWIQSANVISGALSNHLPIIRKAAAEFLYESLCLLDIDEEVLSLLSETSWHDTNNANEIEQSATTVQTFLRSLTPVISF